MLGLPCLRSIAALIAAGLIGPWLAADGRALPPDPAPADQRGEAPLRPVHEMADAIRAEQAELEKLLGALAARAETYEAALLRFICEETLIRSSFERSSGRRSRNDVGRFDYLLSRARSGEVIERRRPLEKAGSSSWKDLKLNHPQPYDWTLLFSQNHQRLFNYRLAGQEVVHYRLATTIDFDAILPYVDGSVITQWSGRAYVDAETLDVLRVEAEPAGQRIRFEVASSEYHRAFRFLGIPMRRRPRARVHEVDLTYQKDGLRFPTLAMTQRYTASLGTDRWLHKQVMQIFTEYQLFEVETDEKLREIRNTTPP